MSTTAQCSEGHGFMTVGYSDFFSVPWLCHIDHLSHFVTELRIHHLCSLITTHHDFDSAGPSSFPDACHI